MSWLLAQLLRNERRRSKALLAKVAGLELALAIARAHTALAKEQRERARLIVAAMVAECGGFSDADAAFLDEIGVDRG